jgi:hypothetical protein
MHLVRYTLWHRNVALFPAGAGRIVGMAIQKQEVIGAFLAIGFYHQRQRVVRGVVYDDLRCGDLLAHVTDRKFFLMRCLEDGTIIGRPHVFPSAKDRVPEIVREFKEGSEG